MRLNTKLAELEATASLCLKCGKCIYGEWPENYPLCSVYRENGIYTASAGGMISFLKTVADKKIGYTTTIANLAYQCNTCGVCDMCELMPVAPPYAKPTDYVRFLRYQLVKLGLIPNQEIKELYKRIQENGDLASEKVIISDKIKDDNASLVLYADCVHSKAELKIYKAVEKLLEKTGERVAVYSEGGCCGSTLYNLGFWDELNSLVEKRAKDINKLKGKQVLFTNPHCQEFLVKRYSDIAPGSPEITGIHFSEYLLDAFKDHKLKPKKAQSIKVSYHDPCYLGRALGIYDAPRQVLSYLDSVKLVEMKRNKANALCCGAGGIDTFTSFAQSVATERAEEFLETGADLLITACPYCKQIFQKVLPPDDKNKVKDIAELVNERTE